MESKLEKKSNIDTYHMKLLCVYNIHVYLFFSQRLKEYKANLRICSRNRLERGRSHYLLC